MPTNPSFSFYTWVSFLLFIIIIATVSPSFRFFGYHWHVSLSRVLFLFITAIINKNYYCILSRFLLWLSTFLLPALSFRFILHVFVWSSSIFHYTIFVVIGLNNHLNLKYYIILPL